jgi:hypothetical protein
MRIGGGEGCVKSGKISTYIAIKRFVEMYFSKWKGKILSKK